MKRYKCLTNNYDISGIYKGFTYPSNKQLLSGKTVSDRVYDYPEDWEMIEDFILPKMWAIKVESHNKDIIYKWKIENTNCSRKSIVDTFTFSDGMYGSSLTEGYTEITFEQFKEYVLKEKPMKKIIGYKLKSDCEQYKKTAATIANYNDSYDVQRRLIGDNNENFDDKKILPILKEAGVLDLWFEPVYEEEFKVGDWVIRTEENYGIHAKGRVLKISNIFGESFEAEQDSSGGHMFECVRKATPEEIESAQIKLPKIGSWTGVYAKDSQHIEYGCKSISIKTINELIYLKAQSISIEDVSVSLNQLKQMIKYVNNL